MMRLTASRHAQRGVTLVVGLIMLVLITLIVTTAFTLSTTNLRSVSNMQLRNEAITAANIAIEQVIGLGTFINNPANTPAIQYIDIRKGNVTANSADSTVYSINFENAPECIRASEAIVKSLSSVTLPGLTSARYWNTTWDFHVRARNVASGAEVVLHQGVRVLIPDDTTPDPVTGFSSANAKTRCGI